MSDNTPPHEGHSGYSLLRERKTIAEILATAMSFEKTARDYYSALIDKVSKPIRDLVQELAEEEAKHYATFEALKNNPEVQQHINDSIQTPASDHRFSDYIQLPELPEKPDDQSILQYALGREHTAMEQYLALAKEVPEGPLQDVFRFLAQEELEHKKELEKRYYETVHSGGV
jgi:rubrerythrin